MRFLNPLTSKLETYITSNEIVGDWVEGDLASYPWETMDLIKVYEISKPCDQNENTWDNRQAF